MAKKDTFKKEIITIKYNGSVCVPAGWRHAEITAKAEMISPKRAIILEVLDINGLGNSGYGSLTGSKRQTFHVGGVAEREIDNPHPQFFP